MDHLLGSIKLNYFINPANFLNLLATSLPSEIIDLLGAVLLVGLEAIPSLTTVFFFLATFKFSPNVAKTSLTSLKFAALSKFSITLTFLGSSLFALCNSI